MAKMIHVTIDGKEIAVEEDTTIIEAAEKGGIRIPTLCYHKKLLPFGACRICIVEVEQMKGRLIPSCSTPVTEGMVINTHTELVIKTRKTTLELLLIHHPLDCPICDKAGECDLQNLVYEYGVDGNRFKDKKFEYQVDYVTPLVERNVNRCVLCGMCVRVCDEIVGVGEHSFVNRGFRTKISTDFDRPMDCEFCGQCINICPVGALNDRLFKFKSRVWDLTNVDTICSYCSTGCTLTLGMKNGKILRVRGDDEKGINKGDLCIKGRFGFQYVESPLRLSTPLVRKGDTLVEASWDEALKTVAEKFREIKKKQGSEAIGGICSARLTNEEVYLFQKFLRSVIGTNNVDHSGGYAHTGLEVMGKSLGYLASTNSLSDIRNADTIFLVRSNLSETHPVVGMRVNVAVKRDNAKLIVASPRNIKFRRFASAFLSHKVGTEVALINGMIAVILKEGLADKEYLSRRADGLEEFEKSVAGCTPEWVEKITGIKQNLLIKAARTFAAGKKAVIIISAGLGLPVGDEKIVRAALNLALITGNLGKEGAGIAVLGEKSNSQGAIDMGALPAYLPGHQNLLDSAIREKFEKAWGEKLSSRAGLGALEMLQEGKLKALYLAGENPLITHPGQNQTRKALAGLEFLVVQDLFLTPTAKLAHVVLPALSFAEKEGTYTNSERRVQRIRKALIGPGTAKSDLEIIQRLGEKMDFTLQGIREIWKEIIEIVPIYQCIDYIKLGDTGTQWPCNLENPQGTHRLYEQEFPKGKVRLMPVAYEDEIEADGSDYPFILLTDSAQFHSGTLSPQASALTQVCPEGYVEMNGKDAAGKGLKDDDAVVVKSRHGEVRAKVKMSRKQPEGVIFIPYHFENVPVNALTDRSMKYVRVNVERC